MYLFNHVYKYLIQMDLSRSHKYVLHIYYIYNKNKYVMLFSSVLIYRLFKFSINIKEK